MGFMDKAKQLAEQAQAKLDDAQKQFNERQSGAGTPQSPPVEYDKHGRPIPQDAPPEPHGDPLADQAGSTPPPPPTAAAPAPDPAAPPSAASAAPGTPPAESPDDPDEPDYAPPKLTGGDPLAG